MKGLILSGGKGTRLRPLTYTRAKQLVPVANKPVLFYGIEAIRDAGIDEIGIIVGETRREIMEAAGDGSRWGVKLTYIQQDEPLGLAHAVMVAEEFLGEDPFVMYLGDNILPSGITDLVNEFRRGDWNSQILLIKVPNPQQFGVAELDDGRVIRLVEKPKEPKSDLALVGVYLFDRHIHQATRNIQPSFRGELEITDAIQYLVDNGFEVRSHLVKGWWKDTGKLEDMLDANRTILDTFDRCILGEVDEASQVQFKVVVKEGARVIRSTIRGPAVIGRNVLIEDSYVGPFTSIQHDSVVRGSEIEHSIVCEHSRIEDIGGRIVDSLIGRRVRLHRGDSKPKAYRFMLGDRSEVGII